MEPNIPTKKKIKKRLFFGLDVDNKWTPVRLTIGIIGLWLLCWVFIVLFFGKWEHRGQFGDMFGSVNALFSGLAFAGIIYTILLQRVELEAQRKELRLTRKEFKQQNATLKLQRFENTFFNLLKFHTEILDRPSVNSTFVRLSQLTYSFGDYRLSDEFNHGRSIQDALTKSNFDGYLRSLIRILDFVINSIEIDDAAKHRYIKYVLASISTEEFTIIFYYITLTSEQTTTIPRLKEIEKNYKLLRSVKLRLIHSTHTGLFEKLDS